VNQPKVKGWPTELDLAMLTM